MIYRTQIAVLKPLPRKDEKRTKKQTVGTGSIRVGSYLLAGDEPEATSKKPEAKSLERLQLTREIHSVSSGHHRLVSQRRQIFTIKLKNADASLVKDRRLDG